MKKRQILETAGDLFTRFGIRRVTIEEVCAKANVSKGTFYKHFSNKNDLVMALLNMIMEGAMAEYRNIMAGTLPFKDKVKRMIRMKMERTGGMSREFLMDIIESGPPEAVAYYKEQAAATIAAITGDFIAAQQRGDIRRTIKPEFILYFFNHMIEMVQDPKLDELYATPGEMINELTNFFFYGVMPEEGYSSEFQHGDAEKEEHADHA
ncbi:TetR/AcrR family transcriptional regulator [bacterium]|nr:TetR/AcrR family transcriptional regulator [bacterium]